MSDIDLDLQTVEEELDTDDEDRRVVLGVLDGTTPGDEWIQLVESGNVLVLAVEGDVNDLAAGFAREVSDLGGDLMKFRDFLVVSPVDTSIDAERV